MITSRKHKLSLAALLMAILCINSSCTKKLQLARTAPEETGHNATVSGYAGRKKLLEETGNIPGPALKAEIITPDIDSNRNLVLIEDKVIETAKQYLGVPHCMGGTTMRCLDCSGLVMIVFEEFGILLPHNAQEQSRFGTLIKKRDDLIKGDIVFFHGSYKTSNYITHSGIYAGENTFIHTSSGKGVTITSMDDSWWKSKFAFGSRIIR